MKAMKKRDIHEKDVDDLSPCRAASGYCAVKLAWETIECVVDGKMRPIGDFGDEVLRLFEEVSHGTV